MAGIWEHTYVKYHLICYSYKFLSVTCKMAQPRLIQKIKRYAVIIFLAANHSDLEIYIFFFLFYSAFICFQLKEWCARCDITIVSQRKQHSTVSLSGRQNLSLVSWRILWSLLTPWHEATAWWVFIQHCFMRTFL